MNRERPDGMLGIKKWLSASYDPLDEAMTGSAVEIVDVYERADEHARNHMEEELAEERRVAERVASWNRKGGSKLSRALYTILCISICCAMIGLLLYTVASLPNYGDANSPINNEVSARYIENGLQETGAVNIVTGMILDYRAFDTLGESSVLFTAAMVVLLLLRLDKGSDQFSMIARNASKTIDHDTFYEPKNDIILQKTAIVLVPFVLLLGVYVVLNGHISPGGGFSGGAIMAAGLILFVTAFGFASIRRFFTYKTYQTIVLCALLTYALSKCYSFYTGANHIHSIIPLGTPGAILSSGLILVLNICVGFVVCCTMYAFYAVFRKGEL